MSLEQLLYGACGAGALLCLISLMMIRRRPLAGFLALCITVSATGGIVVVTRDMLSYRYLGDEELVAKIFVGQKEKQRYVVSIDQHNDEPLQSFMIAGDQWQLDCRILKWKQALARTGVENIYRLDRISGRYNDVDRENDQIRTAYKVNFSAPVDIWHWIHETEFVWRWVDADYGNAVFAPLEDGAQYAVYINHNGLSLRAENPIAAQALRQWTP